MRPHSDALRKKYWEQREGNYNRIYIDKSKAELELYVFFESEGTTYFEWENVSGYWHIADRMTKTYPKQPDENYPIAPFADELVIPDEYPAATIVLVKKDQKRELLKKHYITTEAM